MEQPSDFKTLMIDMDGTLADSMPALYDTYSSFMARFHLNPTKEEFTALTGPSLKEIICALKSTHFLLHSEEELMKIYHDLLIERYSRPIPLLPGSRECISFIRTKGIRCVLVTSAPEHLAKIFLKQQNLENEIDLAVSGSLVKKGKPNPEIYQVALTKVNKSPLEAIAIEDSISGVTSAIAARIPVFWLGGRKGKLKQYEEASVTLVADWQKIHSIFQTWFL